MKRMTIQRKAIMDVFRTNDRPLRIDEIVEIGRHRVNSLNPATVYRNLKILISQGAVIQVSHPVLGTLYERSGKGHHHHFHCHRCDRVYELPGCMLNERECSAHSGFVVEDHEVFLFGLCPSCAG